MDQVAPLPYSPVSYTHLDVYKRQTVYNIDNVPTKQPSTIDSCLLILRDWSCGLSLEQDEIDLSLIHI